MRIKKVSGTAVLQGNIVDSLNSNSSLNAPSIRAVNEGLKNVRGQILWTNPKPTDDFLTQTITLSSDDYDMLEIFYRITISVAQGDSKRFIKGLGTRLMYPSSNNAVVSRQINYISDIQLSFGSVIGADNNNLIPQYIVGYKIGLFNNTSTQAASEEPSSDESVVSDEIISEEPTI